jgi:tetratricopeptide (TPR) repeat protein
MWPASTDQARDRAAGAPPVATGSPLTPLLRRAVPALVTAFLAGCGGAGTKPDAPAAVATGPDPAAVARYETALADLAAGDDLAAEAKLQALASEHPDYAGPLVNLALIHSRRDEIEPAVGLLERALATCTRCAPAWNELGLLQRRQGRFLDAERAYREALAAEPDYANAWFNLGVLYELYLQRPELALEHYARFRELQADDPAGEDIDKWIADLKRRARSVERSAQLEEPR